MPKLLYLGRDSEGVALWQERAIRQERYRHEDMSVRQKVLEGYKKRESAGGRSMFSAKEVKKIWSNED